MLASIHLPVFEILLLQLLSNFTLFANFVGIEMPNSNIGALTALKRAAKEAKRAKGREVYLHAVASCSQTSPIDLSEPHANTDFVDFSLPSLPPPPHLSPKPEKQVAA